MNNIVSFSDIYRLFGNNIQRFGELLDYCKKNNIVLNISLEDTKRIIDDLTNSNANRNDWFQDGKLKTLDGIALIRRDFNVPINNQVVSTASKSTKKKKVTANINGMPTDFEVDTISGYTTISWMMNQEVLPHVSAPSGWHDRTVTIIQPMTEQLYNDADGLDPVDTFFSKPVTLNNAIIICQKEEDAQLARKENPNSTIILFSNMFEYKQGIGNLIAGCLGYRPFYETYHGARLDGEKNYVTDLYTNELQSKYPKLVTTKRPVGNIKHDFTRLMQPFSTKYETIKYIINHTDENCTTIDDFIKSLPYVESLGLQPICVNENTPTLLDLLPDRYNLEKDFFKEITKDYLFDIDRVFALITNGVIVNELNKDALSRIKEIILDEIEQYNKLFIKAFNYIYASRKEFATKDEIIKNVFEDYQIKKLYSLLITKFLYLKAICNSNMINSKIDKSIEYIFPLKYYDFSKILIQGNNPNEGLQDVIGKLQTDNLENNVMSSIQITPYPVDQRVANIIELIDSCAKDYESIQELAQKIGNNLNSNEDMINILCEFIGGYLMENDNDSKLYYMSSILLTIQKMEQNKNIETVSR